MRVLAVASLLLIALALPASAAPPLNLSFQGYLTTSGGTPITGSPSIAFRIYTVPAGGVALWTETIPSVSVNSGIFNVVLGLATPLTLAFNQTYYVGLTVGADPEMVPRTRLTSSPYAFNVADGMVVKSLNTLTDQVRLVAGDNVTVTTAGDSVRISATGTGSAGWTVSGSNVYSAVSGNVGIGTDNPLRPLHVRGTDGALRVDRDMSGGGVGIVLNRYSTSGPMSWRTFALGVDAVGLGDGSFFIADLDTATGGNGTKRLVLDDSGQLGVGVLAPDHRLDVNGAIRARTNSSLGLLVHGSSPTVLLDLVKEGTGEVGSAAARIELHGDGTASDTSGDIRLHTRTSAGALMERMRIATGGAVNFYERDGADRTISLDGGTSSDEGGTIELFADDGFTRGTQLRGEYNGGGGGGALFLYDDAGERTVSLTGQEADGEGAQLQLWTENGAQATVELDAEVANHGNAGLLRIKDSSGNANVILYGDWNGSGNGRVVTDVLEVTGGSDLAESFEVTSSPSRESGIEPGMVVRIAADDPGALVVADRAYDRRVAGVISGAGGVRSGMVMGQQGSLASGSHPVALNGRVYCMADASHGAIDPGDLLTSSDVPGHAMKVRDHARAQGAILGKALTRLESGRGLVLVLVSLQ